MKVLRKHGLSLVCVVLGVVAGIYLRLEPMEPSEVANSDPPFSNHAGMPDAEASLATRLETLTKARGHLKESPILQDLLSADAETLSSFLQETYQANPSDEFSVRTLVRAFAFGRLAELDANAAWALATRSGDCDWARKVVFFAMLRDQPAPVLADRISELGLDMLQEPLQEHPQKAVEILEQLPKGMDAKWFVVSSFALWVEQDAAEAMHLLERVPSRWRAHALRSVLHVMVKSDPGKSLEFMRRLNPRDLDRALRFASLNEVVANEPAAAETFMETLPQGKARSVFFATVFAHKLEQDEDAAVAWLEETLPVIDHEHYSALLFHAGNHPDVLAELFSKMPRESAKSAVPYMVSKWHQKDPAAAATWVAGLPDELRHHVDQDRFYRVAVIGSESSAMARVEALAQIENSRNRNRALRKLGSHLNGLDDAGADQVLANVKDASLRAELRLAMAVEDQSQGRGADEMMKAYLTELHDSELRYQWTAWTAERLMRDPEEAVHWLGDQPQAFYDQQSWLLQSIGRVWSKKDPEAASEWIASLPASAGKDQAIQQLVYSTTAWEPEAALAWTAALSEPGLKELESSRVLRQWSQFDVDAAQEALTAVAGFSDEERRRIRAAANLGSATAP